MITLSDRLGGADTPGHGLVNPMDEGPEPEGAPLLHLTEVYRSTFRRLVVVLLLWTELLLNL